ncbi:MAG: hypothetical protein OXT72_03250 [Gammaproteobacteria bacterium]|nr:hypothetical protein [Gammaproteobacteria bacterium]MDE0249275.1 hypothetical protein [Gammaproteobacteria bacterium]
MLASALSKAAMTARAEAERSVGEEELWGHRAEIARWLHAHAVSPQHGERAPALGLIGNCRP